MQAICTTTLIVMHAFAGISQAVPVIDVVSPATGPIGSEITISGSNFSPLIQDKPGLLR